MSTKIELIDAEALEKKAGQKAARTMQRNWKTILATANLKDTGVLLRNSHVKSKMRYGEVERLSVFTTRVSMIHNYGIEGIDKNGRIMSRKPLNTIDTLFNKSETAIKKLAEELAEIRGHKIATNIANAVLKISKK